MNEIKDLRDSFARLEQKVDSQNTLNVEQSRMISKIYDELKGGEFTVGAFNQIKKNTDDIDHLNTWKGDVDPTIKTLRQTVSALVVSAIAGFVGFIGWLIKTLLTRAVALAYYVAEHIGKHHA